MNDPMRLGRHVLYENFNDIPGRHFADILLLDPPWETTRIGFDTAGFDMDGFAEAAERWAKPTAWIFLFGTLEMAAVFLKRFRRKFEYVWRKPTAPPATRTVMRPLLNHELIWAFINPDLKRVTDLYLDKEALRTKGEPYARIQRTLHQSEYGQGTGLKQGRWDSVENTGYREGLSVLNYSNKGSMHHWEETAHPTQKPLGLLRLLCKAYCPPHGIVLDPTAGSGTALMGADYEGRDFIGAELDPRYRNIIRQRFGATMGAYT